MPRVLPRGREPLRHRSARGLARSARLPARALNGDARYGARLLAHRRGPGLRELGGRCGSSTSCCLRSARCAAAAALARANAGRGSAVRAAVRRPSNGVECPSAGSNVHTPVPVPTVDTPVELSRFSLQDPAVLDEFAHYGGRATGAGQVPIAESANGDISVMVHRWRGHRSSTGVRIDYALTPRARFISGTGAG